MPLTNGMATIRLLFIVVFAFPRATKQHVPTWITVTAEVGARAIVLPCALGDHHANTTVLRWRSDETARLVLGWQGLRLFEAAGDRRSRAAISFDAMKRGECSLTLRNIKETDADTYSAYAAMNQTSDWILLRTVSLKIAAPASPRRQSAPIPIPTSGTASILSGAGGVLVVALFLGCQI